MFGKLLKIRFMSFMQGLKGKDGKKSTGKAVLFAILYAYLGIVFIGLFFGMFSFINAPYGAAGLTWLYYAMVSIFALLLSVFGTAFMTKSQLFEAKDNELLLSMPIAPKYILLSRMSAVAIMNGLFCLVVYLPAVAVRIIFDAPTFAELALAILGFVLTVAFSVTISCLLGYIIALISAKAKNKTLISMIFSIGFLAVYLLFYSRISTYIQLLVQNGDKIADAIKNYLFIFYAFGKGVTGDYLLYLIYAGICLVAFALCAYVISRNFVKIITTKREAEGRKYSGQIQVSWVAFQHLQN